MSKFTLVDEQTHFIIVHKQPDINFHDEGELGQGLFNQVKSTFQTEQLYPVHRLDKLTSGLVIFAKSKQAAQQFQQLFEQHQIEKYYLAISDKKPKKKQGLIKGDMEKSRRSMYRLTRTFKNPAISQFFSYGLDGNRLFLLKPHTGKTHQLRVALSSIGSPILGDELYGKSSADRGYLHAMALRFNLFDQNYQYTYLPEQGIHFQSEAFKELTSQFELPWQLNWPKVK